MQLIRIKRTVKRDSNQNNNNNEELVEIAMRGMENDNFLVIFFKDFNLKNWKVNLTSTNSGFKKKGGNINKQSNKTN